MEAVRAISIFFSRAVPIYLLIPEPWLTPESRLSFIGFDITCEDYDEQDSIGLNPNNTLQTNKHGKVRMVN